MCTRMSKNILKTDVELSYLAGVFDGEGSMGRWSKGKNKGLAFRAQVEMAEGDVVLRFLSYFKKGSVYVRLPRAEKYKMMYHWRVNGEDAMNVVREMLPYLSKRRQQQFHEAA